MTLLSWKTHAVRLFLHSSRQNHSHSRASQQTRRHSNPSAMHGSPSLYGTATCFRIEDSVSARISWQRLEQIVRAIRIHRVGGLLRVISIASQIPIESAR